ncbi:MAG: amidohydrolase [Gammaproteobacteria bacterium]
MTLRVTLVQQSLAWHNPTANLAHFDALLAPLKGSTDVIVLPEMFPTGFSMDAEKLSEPVNGPTTKWLEAKARELNCAITGSVITKDGDHYYNRMLWATPGAPTRRYDKRHLFRMAKEHHHFSPGSEPVVVEWRGFKICLQVCYDLRFPVYVRRRPELEYDLILYVASWPAVRRHAWRTLLKARAIENISYVVGVNRIGKDGNEIGYIGDSAAHDFFGEPLADLGSESAVTTVELDRAALHAFRERFPAHLDADGFTLAP